MDLGLAKTQTKLNISTNLAYMQVTRQAEAKEAEAQRGVKTKRAEVEREKRGEIDLVSATIAEESAERKADTYY